MVALMALFRIVVIADRLNGDEVLMRDENAHNPASVADDGGDRSAPVRLAELRSLARKGGAGSADDPFWISRYGYRKITIYITWLFARLGVSANAATFLSAVAVFLGAVGYGLAPPWAWLVAAVLVQIYFILDHVDGELARYERVRLGKRGGMAGYFYDTACHAGEMAVFAAIALRLYVDLGQPWWVLVLLVLGLFPGSIHPWQRYAEAVLERVASRDGDQVIELSAAWAQKTSLAVTDGQSQAGPGRRLLGLVIQTIGFPGYFATLFIATLLDVIPAVPQIVAGEQRIPYLALWLGVRAAHKAAAGVKSTILYGRRLRHLD